MGKRLIILGAIFYENAINEVEIIDNAEYNLVTRCAIQYGALNNANTRANVLVTRASIDNPNVWADSNSSAATTYSMIPIPYGAKSVTIKCTSATYYYGLCVRDAEANVLYDSGWQVGGGQCSVDLSLYSDGEYITSTLKIGSAGSTSFNNETLESVGWSIEWGK